MAISASFRQDLCDIPILEDAGSLRMKSRDFFWFSPILKETLDDKRADIVVVPRDKADVMRLAAACARNRVPLTVRGGGTGNYGQAVPLAGGVVLDMTKLDQMIWQRPGAGRFGAGARMLDIGRAVVGAAHELRFYPSTRQHATIGGFIAGGAAGAGSCTWGQISDPGAVLAVEVVPIEGHPPQRLVARVRRSQGHARLWRQRHHHRSRSAAGSEPPLVRTDRGIPVALDGGPFCARLHRVRRHRQEARDR